MSTEHYSGFINIVGRPNVGKSTLMNALLGERLSIITSKPQTTRHRIIGILNGDDYQMVFSDTPGVVQRPQYRMQERMNRFVRGAFEDADVMVWLTDLYESYTPDDPLLQRIRQAEFPVILAVNKVDQDTEGRAATIIAALSEYKQFAETLTLSALHQQGTDYLLQRLRSYLPPGPAYYPKDQLTDRPERFFVAEIVREKILEQYKQEVPYSCQVVTDSFKQDPERPLVRIRATIYVARDSQKPIIVGAGGTAIKRLGMAARQSLEQFLDQQVHLELFVKVMDDWRDDEQALERFGYE